MLAQFLVRRLIVHLYMQIKLLFAGFAKLTDKDTILGRILPCVRDLASDASQHVRASLANQISGLAPLLGKDLTIENLLPLFLQLLNDEFPDVRLNIIGKLELVNSGKLFKIGSSMSCH